MNARLIELSKAYKNNQMSAKEYRSRVIAILSMITSDAETFALAAAIVK